MNSKATMREIQKLQMANSFWTLAKGNLYLFMNWKLVLVLALSGVLTGALTLFYIPARFEAIITTPLFIAMAYLIGRYAQVAYFLHGALLGVVHTFIVTAIHIFWVGVYFEHHTKEAAQFAKMSAESGATVVQAMMLMGLFSSVIAGLVLGLFAIAEGRMLQSLSGGKT